MGIRLECPNGHKLNVKESLAGRRGVCPDCGAKVAIPPLEVSAAREASSAGAASSTGATSSASAASATGAASSTNVEEQTGHPFAPPAGDVTAGSKAAPPLTSPPSSPALDSPSPPRMPLLEPLPLEENGPLWYIRSAQGGQYGPATTDVVRHWISEGRVTPDCWVWCTGWPDWKSGVDALPSFAPGASPSILPVVREPTLTVTLGAPTPGNPLTAVDRQREKQNRRRRQRQITWGMTLLVIVLAAVLIYVLRR